MKNKKQVFSKLLAASLAVLLVTQGIQPVSTQATATPIPVAVEADSFTDQNVSSSDMDNTLIKTTGSATAYDNKLLLTPDQNDQVGTAVRRNRMLLSESGFSTYFKMQMNNSSSPADGLCFIVYQADTDETKTGEKGGGVGFLGITSADEYSIGVEFDTYRNPGYGDPVSGHVAIDTNGEVFHDDSTETTSTDSASPTDDGTSNIAHTYSSLNNTLLNVWVDYDGVSGYITVTYGTSASRTSSSNYSFKREVGTNLVGKNVYVGFSASTGGSKEKHEVTKWYFSNNYEDAGLSSADNAYVQGASSATIDLNVDTDPTSALIKLYDAVGNNMEDQSFTIKIDGVKKGTTYITSTSGYTYSIPDDLTPGTHTITITSDDGGVVKAQDFVVTPDAPTIVTNPADATKSAGASASFTVDATVPSGGVITYEWQVSTDNGENYEDVDGEEATFSIDSVSGTQNGYLYRCIVTNTQASLTKSVTTPGAKLTVTKKATSVSTPVAVISDIYQSPTPYTLSATISGVTGALSGRYIYFYEGSTVLGIGTTNEDGTASVGYSGFTEGTHSITAVYEGDENNQAATSSALSLHTLSEIPNAPTLTDTVDGSSYNNDWTSKDVVITASGSEASAGINCYQYKIGADGTWTIMPNTVGTAHDSVTISSDVNSTIYVRAITNTDKYSETTSVVVKRDAVTPVLNVAVTGTIGEWTTEDIAFTLSNTAENISGTTFYVKKGSGEYQAITGTTFTISDATNTTYVFKGVSGAGLTGTVSATYTVKLTTETLKEVIDSIDALPDPDASTDEEILNHEIEIKDTKVLYDTLTTAEKKEVGDDRTDKLNKLLNKLESLLQIVGKDVNTGIFSDNIGTSVLVPELNQEGVGKVLLELVANPITDTEDGFAGIAVAKETLNDAGQELIAAFDMGIFKSVFDNDGAQLSYGKVANSDITGDITIRVPVPEAYIGSADLQVVYIDDAGVVTPLTTKYITEDGVDYLEFTTSHFSVYGIITTHNSDTPTGDHTGIFWMVGLALTTGGVVVYTRKRKHKVTVA